jgi:type II secretory pathway component PulJ
MPHRIARWEELRRACAEARADYERATMVIETMLDAKQNPTLIEWQAEQAARDKLLEARKKLAEAALVLNDNV